MSVSVWFIAILAIALLAAASVRRIPEGTVYSLRRLGGQTRIVGSGTRFVLPLVERVSHKISLTGSALEVNGEFASGEPYKAALYFQVLDPQRADHVIESIDRQLRERAVDLLASNDTPIDPAARRLWLKQNLNAEVGERGLLVTRVDLRAAA
jgi:regulator of protease activity HflC (stomatin/prohibitin superfamily)